VCFYLWHLILLNFFSGRPTFGKLGRYSEHHTSPFHLGQLLYLTMSFQSLGKLEQEQLSSFFESDSPASEMYDNLDLSAIAKKLSSML
jgi:hypothetical protein